MRVSIRSERYGRGVAVGDRQESEAAFARPQLYDALEERQVDCAVRLPANDILEHNIAELLRRPPGTADQWIQEAKQAVALTRLSCRRFRAKKARRMTALSELA